jgi:hypothetical protein
LSTSPYGSSSREKLISSFGPSLERGPKAIGAYSPGLKPKVSWRRMFNPSVTIFRSLSYASFD